MYNVLASELVFPQWLSVTTLNQTGSIANAIFHRIIVVFEFII